MDEPRPHGHPGGRITLAVAVVLAPWIWFLVRDIGGDMDIVAVALPAIGVVALLSLGLVAVLRRRLLPLLAGLSVFTVCAVATVGPRVPRRDPPPVDPVRIAMANVYEANPIPDQAFASLAARDPDVLVAVEMREGFWQRLGAATSLPYGVTQGELGVRARYPLSLLPAGALARWRLIRVRIDAPAPFVLYVTHADNPFHDATSFSDQRRFVRDIVRAASSEDGPVVIVGDFNMSDRSENYRIMDGAFVDAMREDHAPWSTYFGGLWPLLLVRIDHAFVSRGWCAAGGTTFVVPGSDHRGIQVTVGPCPQASP
jgi:endonuclease/exonuclease/phosphatase (EEP) superfamily protein YafD